MKKVLIIQPTDIVNANEIFDINEYIQKGINSGVIVLNKNMVYEIVEIDDINVIKMPRTR